MDLVRGRAPTLDGTSSGTTAASHYWLVLLRVQLWDNISAGTMSTNITATVTTVTSPAVPCMDLLQAVLPLLPQHPLIKKSNNKRTRQQETQHHATVLEQKAGGVRFLVVYDQALFKERCQADDVGGRGKGGGREGEGRGNRVFAGWQERGVGGTRV